MMVSRAICFPVGRGRDGDCSASVLRVLPRGSTRAKMLLESGRLGSDLDGMLQNVDAASVGAASDNRSNLPIRQQDVFLRTFLCGNERGASGVPRTRIEPIPAEPCRTGTVQTLRDEGMRLPPCILS